MERRIIRISDKNTKSVVMNIVYSFGIKGLSMFIGLFTTPAYIRYFHNNEIMGVWFTILSVLAWILNCDMGIGNGSVSYTHLDVYKRQEESNRMYRCVATILWIDFRFLDEAFSCKKEE